jgi:hypothetical protein
MYYNKTITQISHCAGWSISLGIGFPDFPPATVCYISGISTYLTLTDQFFSAVGSLTEVKRQFINSFVSGTGGEEFLLRAQGGGPAYTIRTYGTVLSVH